MDPNRIRDLVVRSAEGPLPLTEYTSALHELAVENEAVTAENNALKIQAAEDAPKVEFYDIVADSTDLINFSKVSKMLCFKNNRGKIIGRTLLFEFLREKGILLSDGDYHNFPASQYVDSGYFQIKPTIKNGKVKYVPLATMKGVRFVAKLLMSNNFSQVKAKDINDAIPESQKLLFQ
jgi:phage antirepressor YoqD-like protein